MKDDFVLSFVPQPVDAAGRVFAEIPGGRLFEVLPETPPMSPGAKSAAEIDGQLIFGQEHYSKLVAIKNRAKRSSVLTRAQVAELEQRADKLDPETAEFALVYILQKLKENATTPRLAFLEAFKVMGYVLKLFPE